MINIQDSSNRWLPSISIMGKSTQTKTNGYQLLNLPNTTNTVNGYTIDVVNGVIHLTGSPIDTTNEYTAIVIGYITTVLSAGTYTLWLKNRISGIGMTNVAQGIQNITRVQAQDYTTTTITEGKSGRTYCGINVTHTLTDLDVYLMPMLYSGSYDANKDFEVYSGGKPSPSIDYPQTIVDTTSEEIEITDGTNTQTANFNLTLRGIPVSSGGNYTDGDGQQWMCDTIERYADGSGKHIQRIGREDFDGTEEWTDIATNSRIRHTLSSNALQSNSVTPLSISGHFSTLANNYAGVGYNNNNYVIDTNRYVISPTINGTRLTASEWKTYLSTHNGSLEYVLTTPVETPLTKEQLDALNLSTYYPTTTIVSSPDIEIEYVCDTKNYINRINNN